MIKKDVIKEKIKLSVQSLNLFYGENQALFNLNMDILEKKVTAFIGPSGCGKSTLLRCFNRMNSLIQNCNISGQIILDQKININSHKIDEVLLRTKIGMVFQKPNPFPRSIYENIAYAPRIHGIVTKNSQKEKDLVEKCLIDSGLFNEVKDRLNSPAMMLSGGQQQRLCIARSIAINPEVLLMDEPCSALDPISTAKIEELIDQLSKDYTIIIVTHSMQQAARVSDFTAFFNIGKLIEYDVTSKVFTNPSQQMTNDYITGRYG